MQTTQVEARRVRTQALQQQVSEERARDEALRARAETAQLQVSVG